MTHGLTDAQFHTMVSSFLGPYYLALALMNGLAALYLWRSGQLKTWLKVPLPFVGQVVEITNALVWLVVGVIFVLLGAAAFGGGGWVASLSLSEGLRDAINQGTGPVIYSVGTTVALIVLYFCRSFFVKPAVAWTIWNLMWLFLGLSMTDSDFYEIVAKPDNVPIVMLVFLLAFFTWLGTYRAVQNDDRLARGEPPLEKVDDEKVLVWPDLVYIELVCMIGLSAVFTMMLR